MGANFFEIKIQPKFKNHGRNNEVFYKIIKLFSKNKTCH